jgi:hypothetical protein
MVLPRAQTRGVIGDDAPDSQDADAFQVGDHLDQRPIIEGSTE